MLDTIAGSVVTLKAIALLALVSSMFAAPLTAAAADRGGTENAKRDAPVAVGDIAPDFSLEDQDGRRHALSAQRGKQPVVLVFYRGYW
jgi:cytochrome oxidase Cu insertion factor (SCO1/SenC/PrrC family)